MPTAPRPLRHAAPPGDKALRMQMLCTREWGDDRAREETAAVLETFFALDDDAQQLASLLRERAGQARLWSLCVHALVPPNAWRPWLSIAGLDVCRNCGSRTSS